MKIRKRETKHKARTPKILEKKSVTVEELPKLKKAILRKEPTEEPVEETKVKMIAPLVSEMAAKSKLEGHKRYILFGPKAKVSKIVMELHPIYCFKVKYLKKKLLGSDFEEVSVYFDGTSGDIVIVKSGLSQKCSTKEFIGLGTESLKIFDALSNSKRSLTIKDLKKKFPFSKSAIRDKLKELADKGLVSNRRFGRNFYYFPMTKNELPDLNKCSQPKIEFSEKKVSASKLDFEIDEKDLREFLKSLAEKVMITDVKKAYYPFYKAFVESKNKRKTVKVDGISGSVTH